MALAFGASKGSAVKNTIPQYQYKNGDNQVRMVGGLLPRYVYWVAGFNNKNIPFECLGFDREAEAFTNVEKDFVREAFPDLKCGWAYAINCIDPTDGEIKVLNLKKKLMEQIMVAAEELGDPTDPETGWSIHFKKVKTGPNAYNVEYQFQALKCKPCALTEEEVAKVAAAKSVDEWLPRPTPETQKALLDTIREKSTESEGKVADDVKEEFDIR